MKNTTLIIATLCVFLTVTATFLGYNVFRYKKNFGDVVDMLSQQQVKITEYKDIIEASASYCTGDDECTTITLDRDGCLTIPISTYDRNYFEIVHTDSGGCDEAVLFEKNALCKEGRCVLTSKIPRVEGVSIGESEEEVVGGNGIFFDTPATEKKYTEISDQDYIIDKQITHNGVVWTGLKMVPEGEESWSKGSYYQLWRGEDGSPPVLVEKFPFNGMSTFDFFIDKSDSLRVDYYYGGPEGGITVNRLYDILGNTQITVERETHKENMFVVQKENGSVYTVQSLVSDGCVSGLNETRLQGIVIIKDGASREEFVLDTSSVVKCRGLGEYVVDPELSIVEFGKHHIELLLQNGQYAKIFFGGMNQDLDKRTFPLVEFVECGGYSEQECFESQLCRGTYGSSMCQGGFCTDDMVFKSCIFGGLSEVQIEGLRTTCDHLGGDFGKYGLGDYQCLCEKEGYIGKVNCLVGVTSGLE